MRSAHDVYRSRLALLSRDEVLQAMIRPVTEPEHTWTRVYARFTPGHATGGQHGPYTRLVYARADGQSLVTLDVFEDAPSADSCERVCHYEDLGWVGLTRFPSDDRLPSLAAALAVDGDVTIVRYRPGRRCTFRVERGADVRYGKVFPRGHGDSGTALHEAGTALWGAAARSELGFAVAEPVAWDAARQTLWQRAVRGDAVAPALAGPDAVVLGRRLGQALATLTRSSVRPVAAFTAAVQCTRSRAYADELAIRVPSLATQATALIDALEAVHADRPARALPIHGAPHIHQWLTDSQGRLALVDFDRLSVGDPELDVATFLGELDFEDGLHVPRSAIAAAFVDGYESVTGPLDATLAAAYRAHKRLAKALRSARAVRTDGDRRAAVHLTSAGDALAARTDTVAP